MCVQIFDQLVNNSYFLNTSLILMFADDVSGNLSPTHFAQEVIKFEVFLSSDRMQHLGALTKFVVNVFDHGYRVRFWNLIKRLV